MGTNNFTFKNICVMVHEEDDDNDLIDFDLDFWAEDIATSITGFNSFTKGDYIDETYILSECDIYKVNGEHYATIYATYQSGYYSGACLDYRIKYGEEIDNPIKTYEDKVEAKCKALEKVLKGYGTEIAKVGGFSDGTAVYEVVK